MSGARQTTEIGRDSLAELFTGSSSFVERMPMLRVALERTAEHCTDVLRTLGGQAVTVTLQDLASGTASEQLEPWQGKSIVAVIHAAQWNARMIALADQATVFSAIEIMLGSDGTQPPYEADRHFTRIEGSVAGAFLGRFAASLESAFADVAPAGFSVESLGEEVDYDVLGKPTDAVVLARFRLEGLNGGEVVIAIARAALSPLKQALSRAPAKEAPAPDARWSQQIQHEVTRTHVTVTAVLDERAGTLGEVTGFKVGQVVELNATAQGRVRLECNGERLMWCHLGKSQGKYTLRVDEMVDREQEFLDEILAG